MVETILYLPSKRKNLISGAQAYAEFLEYLLIDKQIPVAEVNGRLTAWADRKKYNHLNDRMEKEIQEKRK